MQHVDANVIQIYIFYETNQF